MLSGLISLERSVETRADQEPDVPVYETKVMHRLDRENTLCHVELCHVLGECVVFDEPGSLDHFLYPPAHSHGHQVAAR